jgi:hypothetical protein
MYSKCNRMKEAPTQQLTNRGLALLPDEAFSSKFIELQRQAMGFLQIEPRLSLTGNLPHLTLVQGRFNSAVDLSQLLNTVRESLSASGNYTLQPTQVVYKPRGWIFLEVAKDALLDRVHREVADSSSEHMKPPEDLNAPLKDYSEDEKASFRRYGYRYMYHCFYPHVTLGRLETPPTEAELQQLSSIATTLGVLSPFRVARASVYDMGPNGAHARAVITQEIPAAK